jgi:hypothetical protein
MSSHRPYRLRIVREAIRLVHQADFQIQTPAAEHSALVIQLAP